jgi:hypothetical protein
MKKVVKNPTLFVDIDGTLVKYRKFSELAESTLTPIQDVIDFVNSHFDSGSVIIITTARPETYREFTENELGTLGIKYNQIVMNCGRGTRVVLNDIDPDKPELPRAIGINLERDGGLREIEIPSYISPYESD